MKLVVPSLRKIAFLILGLIVAGVLFLWQALPRILQSQAEKFVAERTGHRLVMDRPEFNPFELALRLGKLRLSDPEGKPLFGFDGLLVDISGASIARRALVFDAVRVDRPLATLVELPGGRNNWTPFIDALASGEARSDENKALPRLNFRHFALAGGKVDYADRRRTAEGFSTSVEPLDLELHDLSTLPDDKGRYKVSARTSLGAQIELEGKVDLNPIMVAGTFKLTDLQLAKLAPYLKNALPVPPEGVLAVAASYQAGNDGGKFEATVDQIQARLTGLRVALKEANGPVASVEAIELKDGRFKLSTQELVLTGLAVTGGKLALPGIEQAPSFGALTVDAIKVALAERNATVGTVRLAEGRVQAVRRADGSLDLQAALESLSGGKPAAGKPEAEEAAPETAKPWHFKVARAEIANLGVVLREDSVKPALELALDNIAAQVDGVSDDMNAALPVKLSFDARTGGHFEASGKVVPGAASADVEFKLTDLALKLAQPFLAAKTTLTLADGRLSSQGRAIYNEKGPHVKGGFAVRDLRLMEPGDSKPLLAWKTFDSRNLVLTQKALDLGELRLSGLNTRLHIDKDKNINFKQVLKPSGAEQPALAEPPPASAVAASGGASASAVAPAPTFIVNIDRLRFYKGQMDFADESLILPFGTLIHDLQGSIAGLSNRPDAVGQVELDGQVDEYGLARAVGHVELGNPTNSLDLRVQFRNVEMTSLTPYTAHFAGRKIESGKLSLDLQYKIDKRQLSGENQVIMDQLTLGERVEHPGATSLPLDLAIAILKDSDGRIDLGLPVSGSLDDPQFSYGSIIWKAITNVLTKIVTAPFRALGALFGGGGEKFENLLFDPGAAQLTPPEREKVARLAGAMNKRPGLVLEIGGVHVDADRIALQDVQLRRTVLTLAGQRVPERGDPGPISTQQPKIREALEALFKERIGAADLAALKEGFRGANPGQLEESVTGKVMSRLSGLMREKKTLSASEVAQLKGADFYGLLFERLRTGEEVSESRLQDLARKRGEGVAEILKAAGVASERVQLLPPEKGKTDGEQTPQTAHEVALHMSLKPATSK